MWSGGGSDHAGEEKGVRATRGRASGKGASSCEVPQPTGIILATSVLEIHPSTGQTAGECAVWEQPCSSE